MNEYIRSALRVLNTNYPGYSFEIEEFGGCVLLWCRYQVRNLYDDEIDTEIIRSRIEKADLSYEKIVEEGKRLMNKINQEELRNVVCCGKNLIRNNSYYGMWPGNKYTIAPKELIFQDEKTTIINWTDGTKTIVKCSDDDVFSPEAGVALCYMKKFITDNDSERFHRILKSLISVSKFKKSKQEEENHDIDTGASDNSSDNDPDGSAVEVES